MTDTFSNSCKEVYDIIKELPNNELAKIPKEEIEFLENNMNRAYHCNFDVKYLNENFNISQEAKAIIVILWKKYFANDVQRKKLEIILEENQRKSEEIRKEKYSYDNIFKKKLDLKEKNISMNSNENNKEKLLVITKKENIFIRIKQFIKSIFGK